MKKIFKKVLFLAIFFSGFLLWGNVQADTHTAATCSYSDVNTAVTAAETGDTVSVPVGECDWGASSLSVSKAIQLVGSGSGSGYSCNGEISTCISGTGTLLNIVTPATPQSFPFRLTNFYLNTSASNMMNITGAGRDWRIDHNYLYHVYVSGKAVIGVTANVAYWTLYGLFDSNIFKNVYIYFGGGSGSSLQGWQADSQWGTGEACFVENNLFDHSDIGLAGLFSVFVDGQCGARATVRYNLLYDTYIMAHATQANNVISNRSYEVYNNSFRIVMNNSGAAWGGYASMRGGSAEIHHNQVAGRWAATSTYYGPVVLDNRRSWWDGSIIAVSQCNGVGTALVDSSTVHANCCTGVGTGTCSSPTAGFGDCAGDSPYDGNEINSANGNNVDGWPCGWQIGRGKQTGIMGSGGTQEADPIYVWDNVAAKNCLGGENIYGICTSDSDCPDSTCSTPVVAPNSVYLHNNSNNQPYHIVENRDYYAGIEKTGYSTYVCPHPLANLDGSCDENDFGRDGYNIITGDIVAPASPTGLSVT